MTDESIYVSRALLETGGIILQSSASERQRIAHAYQEARTLVATIPLDNGDARPQIIACFEQYDLHRAAGDIACEGWMLMSLEIRVNERDLRDWETLHKLVRQLVGLLPVGILTVH